MNGYYVKGTHVKDTATPIDNITKFAWDDDDYEEVEVWHEYTDEELANYESAKKTEEFIQNGPAIQATYDDAICALYEMILGGYGG